MHAFAAAVLGKAHLQGFVSPHHAAYHLMVLGQASLPYQQVQRGKPASSGNDFMLTGFPVLLYLLSDNDVVNEHLGRDQCSQFLD
jgi:hypothetical protein